MEMTDLEKRRLKKLQDAANTYQEMREAHGMAGVRLNKMHEKVYGDFEKFWAAIRKRNSEL